MSYLFIWLNDPHQLLVHADDVNKFGGSVHTIMKNTVMGLEQQEMLIRLSTQSSLEIRMQDEVPV